MKNEKEVTKNLLRYPILPLLVMMIVLILPALFADLIVPHDPIVADLQHRLEPPAWIGAKVTTKTIVDVRQDRRSEITLADAQGLTVGTAVGQTPSLNQDLALGDTVEIITKPAGSWDRPLGTDKLGRDLLSRIHNEVKGDKPDREHHRHG